MACVLALGRPGYTAGRENPQCEERTLFSNVSSLEENLTFQTVVWSNLISCSQDKKSSWASTYKANICFPSLGTGISQPCCPWRGSGARPCPHQLQAGGWRGREG